MGKYEPLEQFLSRQERAEIRMTFKQIERVLGFALPNSARAHRPWWANETAGHVHARSWLQAGFETAEVDMAGERLVFRRMSISPPSPLTSVPGQKGKPSFVGALKGLLWIDPTLDLTKPAMADTEWESAARAKYGAADRK